jgi:hypothetical protein
MIAHTSITELEKMPLSKLLAYNAELEAVLKKVKTPEPGKV